MAFVRGKYESAKRVNKARKRKQKRGESMRAKRLGEAVDSTIMVQAEGKIMDSQAVL